MTVAVRATLLTFALVVTGCSAGRYVWGIDKEEFLNKLHQGDYTFIKSLTPEERKPDEILKLAPSAPFYFSYIYQKLNMPDDAATMLQTAADHSPDPWRQEAGIMLLQQEISASQYADAEKLGVRLFREYPRSMDIFVLYTESLYWLEKDKQVLDNLRSIERVGTQGVKTPELQQRIADGELQLWEAASAARLGMPDWKALVGHFFLDRAAVNQHNRLWIFLDYRKPLLAQFSSEEQDAFHAISELSQSNYATAMPLFGSAVNDFLHPPAPSTSTVDSSTAGAAVAGDGTGPGRAGSSSNAATTGTTTATTSTTTATTSTTTATTSTTTATTSTTAGTTSTAAATTGTTAGTTGTTAGTGNAEPAAPGPAIFTPMFLENMTRAYSGGGQSAKGAALMNALSARLSGVSQVVASEDEAKLLLRAGQAKSAQELLTQTLNSIAKLPDADSWYTPRRRDRVIWYLLDAAFTRTTAEMPAMLNQYLPATSDPSYFSDLEESLLSQLVDNRQWSIIQQVHDVLSSNGQTAASAAYAVVLAEAMQKGLLLRDDPNRESTITSLLQEAAGQSEDLYYRFVAEAGLKKRGISINVGELLQLIPTNEKVPTDATDSSAGPNAANGQDATNSGTQNPGDNGSQTLTTPPITAGDPGSSADAEKIVSGFFDFGLLSDAASWIRDHAGEIPVGSLVSDARKFSDATHVTDSIRTLDLAAGRPNFRFTRSLALMMYPQAYPSDMSKVSREEGIQPYLFYGLVREESYFDAGISSRVGAIGLTQLMPGTAADVASRFGWHDPNLSDPATNLRLGARYLRVLLDAFQQPVLALAAYNGGLGRVRQWEQSKSLPSMLLFHESIPLPETRNYIRKILVSAVYYGYLYDDLMPSQVVAAFFPDLM